MKVKIFPVGYFGTNCYVIMDEASSDIAVIDPGDAGKFLIEEINKMGGKVKYVLLTHVHADHTGAVQDIVEHFKVPVYLSEKDEALIEKGNMLFNPFNSSGKADEHLKENQTIKLGETEIKCIETPGHTPGGISFLVKDYLFSGDTLFRESIGRTDFPGGNYQTLINSINSKLIVLPEDTRVLPGHGPDSTIKYEKQFNPFL